MMCPECFANAALIVSGALSTGGVSVLAVTMFRPKKTTKNSIQRSSSHDDSHIEEHTTVPEDRNPRAVDQRL